MSSATPPQARATPGRRRAARISFAGSLAQTAISFVKGFLFVPIYLHHFDLSVYGAYLASANIVGLLGLLEFGFATILLQRLSSFFGAGDEGRFVEEAASGLVLTVTSAFLIVLLAFSIAPFIPDLINAPPEIRVALVITIRLTAIGAAASIAAQCVNTLCAAWQRPTLGAVSRVVGQLVEAGCILAGLRLNLGLKALGWGSAIGGLSTLLLMLLWSVVTWRQLGLRSPRLSWDNLRSLFIGSTPLFFGRLVGQIVAYVDVPLISRFVGAETAAIFGLTDRTLKMAANVVNPVAGASTSGMAHLYGEGGAQRARGPLKDLFASWSFVAAVTVPVIVGINRDFLGLWLGRQVDHDFLSVALGAATLLSSRAFLLSCVLTAFGGIRSASGLAMAEPLIRLPLLAAGLAVMGPVGMPLASCAVLVPLVVFAYPRYITRRMDATAEDWAAISKRGRFSLLLSCLVGLLFIGLPTAHSWGWLLPKAGACFLATVVINLSGNEVARKHGADFLRRCLRTFGAKGPVDGG